MQNFLEYRNCIGYKGLGLILGIKENYLKIPYQILANGSVLKISNLDVQFLTKSILAQDKEQLDKSFQQQLVNLYRKYLKNKNEINLKVASFLENTFELDYYSSILPKTSLKPLIYLSKYASLSMIYNEKTGDFGSEYFSKEVEYNKNRILCGEGLETNTNFIYGNMEIIEISNFLTNTENVAFDGDKYYMATHHRAIVDLVLEHIFKNKTYENKLIEFRDFFIDDYLSDDESDFIKIRQMLEMAFPYLNLEQQNEIKRWYYTYN